MQRKNYKKLCCFVSFALITITALGNDFYAQTKAEKFDEFMQLCNDYRIFNGAVLVAENGKVIYKKAFGPAHREWDVPNTVDTKYIIGSISKQFTAMLMLQLVEEGKVRLEL